VLDALLRGPGWIALVGVLLAGIVFFNVDLLQLNRNIATTAQRSSGIARENARLRLELAKLDSSERIQRSAASRGLLLPAPGDVRYLRANPMLDARRAAKLVATPGTAPAQAPVATPAPVVQAAPTPVPQPATATPQPIAAQPQAAPVPATAAPTG
jgi:cell division protein FtsL